MLHSAIKNSTIILIILFMFSCKGQTQNKIINKSQSNTASNIVGGPFENRDVMLIGMPKNIKATDTSPGWNQKGQKLLISGTIYKKDGKSPASNIILYYYHTDIYGKYASTNNLDARVSRHGYIRGWVKSDINGQYAIYTTKPASYPNSQIMAHIHPAIKEPNINNAYYIDEWVFDDDPFLTNNQIKNMKNRGGNGILKTTVQGNLQVAIHDITLGLNIPNYPKQ